MTHTDPLLSLLTRAADGDQQAAADFWALRAANIAITERSQALARQQAWRMIRHPEQKD